MAEESFARAKMPRRMQQEHEKSKNMSKEAPPPEFAF